MAKQYKWKTSTDFESDTSLSYGVIPADTLTWQLRDVDSPKSGTWEYWYRDSDYMEPGGIWTDANSSRVVVSVTQSWTTSVDNRNNLTAVVNTTINSIRRDDLRGNNPTLFPRTITIYEYPGGPAALTIVDNDISSAHTIYTGPLVLQSNTVVLAPGENLTSQTLKIYNLVGTGPSYDDIDVGVRFLNPLPKDYRPGATLDTNASIWKSHDRANGACHVLSDTTNMTWKECRTLDGDTGGRGNPPSILHQADANSWYNQKLLGKR